MRARRHAIALTNFRSYARVEIAAGGAPVVLAGPNGAGKTNLLDAISLLSPGRGLRGAKLAEHTRKGPDAHERGTVGGRRHDRVAVARPMKSAPAYARRKRRRTRQVRLNGAAAQSSADLGELVQMLWLTPAMDRLFIESASGRRRFLDRLTLGFDASHARTHRVTSSAMRERARLLKYRSARSGMARRARSRDGRSRDRDRDRARERGRAAQCARCAARGDAGAFPCGATHAGGRNRSADCRAAATTQRIRCASALRAARVRDAEAGRTSVRAASQRSCRPPHAASAWTRATVRPASRRRCSFPSCWPMHGSCRLRATACARSCSSTKSPPIWTPPPRGPVRGNPRARRPGVDDGDRAFVVCGALPAAPTFSTWRIRAFARYLSEPMVSSPAMPRSQRIRRRQHQGAEGPRCRAQAAGHVYRRYR